MHQRMCPKATPRAGDHVAGSTSRVRLVLGPREKWQEFDIVYSYMVCFKSFCSDIPTASLSYLFLLSDVSHMGSKKSYFLPTSSYYSLNSIKELTLQPSSHEIIATGKHCLRSGHVSVGLILILNSAACSSCLGPDGLRDAEPAESPPWR